MGTFTRIIFFLIILEVLYINGSTQPYKRLLDTSDLRNFRTLMDSRFVISNNGKYIAFDNARSQLKPTRGKTIKPVNNRWEKVIDNVQGEISFTSDSHCAIFLGKDRRLGILYLGKNITEYVSGVQSYKLLTYSKGKDYLMVDKRISGGGLILRDLSTFNEYYYGNPDQYYFSSQSSVIIFNDSVGTQGQSIYHFENGKKAEKIWSSSNKITQLILSKSGNQVAFCTESDIFYYEKGKTQLAIKLNIPYNNEFADLKVIGQLYFSPFDNLLLFRMEQSLASLNSSVNPVGIFNYLDGSFDLNAYRKPLIFDCFYDCRTGKITRACYERETLESISTDGNSLLISCVSGKDDEYNWNKKALHKDFVMLVESGKKVPITTQRKNNMMSPSGRFVVGQNDRDGDIISLDVLHQSTYNLTTNLPIPMNGVAGDGDFGANSRLLNWDTKVIDDRLIIYDQYDIWVVNLEHPTLAINLTNGYGRKNHIIFRVTEEATNYLEGQEIILSAFNEYNKNSGFYKVRIGSKAAPEKLCMGNYQYVQLRKCVDVKRWILKRMSSNEAPNYYWTDDFHSFHAITNVCPEKDYYWYSTELINYKTKDGVNNQALLYKPGNFDSTKKYPVLFTFYEKESKKLNEYIIPAYTEQFSFNIPLMVGRGYLICVPDIHFKIGETAHCIVDCVEGAADYLSKFSFTDSLHYGACGGSFGGYGVNCLAAFSKKFSALVPISGVSDFVSGYSNFPGLAVDAYETGQNRMGVSFSTNPELYIRNSPVAYAKFRTPILIVSTPCDYNVNVQQSIGWFISLRREGKPVWMLRYKGAEISHGIYILNDQIDLGIRMNQFFDHYLKNAPAPLWMKGMSNQDAGVRSGYEYDSTFSVPFGRLLKDSL